MDKNTASNVSTIFRIISDRLIGIIKDFGPDVNESLIRTLDPSELSITFSNEDVKNMTLTALDCLKKSGNIGPEALQCQDDDIKCTVIFKLCTILLYQIQYILL